MHARSVALTVALLSFTLAACAPAAGLSGLSGQTAPGPADTVRAVPALATAPALVPSGALGSVDAARRPSSAGPSGTQALAERAAEPGASAAGQPIAASESSAQLPIVQNLGRMIIYTTDLTLLADSLDVLPDRVGTIALAHGGYVAGIETKEEAGIATTIIRVKVPPASYEATMRELRGLAVEVRGEKATTRDVTEEHSDVTTQIASLEATHAQLLEILKRSGSVDEVLKVQQQAGQVKLQIDRLKGRMIALERLSEFATITIKAQLASAALQREYTTVRSALRRAEAVRAALDAQLRRVHTPEEESVIRDKLAEAILEVSRHQTRIADVEAKAASIKVTLPTAEGAAFVARLDETLPKEYIDVRVALRRAEHEQTELTRAIRAGAPDADPTKLSELILRVNQLKAQLRTVQERATQAGIALPQLTPEQEAALADITPPGRVFEMPTPIRVAWEASLTFLLLIASAAVFFWWVLPLVGGGALVVLRRRAAPPVPAQS